MLELKDDGIDRQAPEAAGMTFEGPDYSMANSWVDGLRCPSNSNRFLLAGIGTILCGFVLEGLPSMCAAVDAA